MKSDALTTGRDETLGSRLRIMVELAPSLSEPSAKCLAERLQAAGLDIEVRVVQAHLDGFAVPTAAERSAYAHVCQWHEDTSLLADDPQTYLLPLVQAEILLALRLIGMPQSRGGNELQALSGMSVRELRDYRRHLRYRGRERFVAA